MDKLPSPSHQRKKTWLDKLVMWVVVIIAGVVVLLSFHNTASLAEELKLNPYLTAGLVEILFAVLLGIRARQRATQRNVPLFIHIGFYASFIFVTGVNMYGLSKQNPIVGSIVGLAISGSMWLMENTLVWLWTESHLPHKKTARELKKEAKREIKEMKIRQKIEWMLWEAQKPDLKLIQKARKAEEEREMVVAEGLPEYFRNELDYINNTFENEASQIVNSQFANSQITNAKFEDVNSQIVGIGFEITNSQNSNEKFEISHSQIANSQIVNEDPQVKIVEVETTNTQIANGKFEDLQNANVGIESVDYNYTSEELQNVAESQNVDPQITNAEFEVINLQISNEKSQNADSQITNENSVDVKFETTNSRIANEDSQNTDMKFENEESQIANEDSQNLFEKYATQIANEGNEAVRHAMKRAIEYHIENDKFPTIEGLMEYASVSQWHARLALNKLRGRRKKRRKVS